MPNQPGDDHNGSFITRRMQTIATPPKVYEDGIALLATLRARTKMKISHSKLLAILIKIAVRYQAHIDVTDVSDDETLQAAIARSIAKGIIEERSK